MSFSTGAQICPAATWSNCLAFVKLVMNNQAFYSQNNKWGINGKLRNVKKASRAAITVS